MGKRSSKKAQDKGVNYQAQRWFIGITLIMTFISLISGMGSIYYAFYDVIGQLPEGFTYSRQVAGYFSLTLLLYIIAMFGIFKPQPPLHHAGTLASMINVVIQGIVVFGARNSGGLIILVLASIHSYLGLRFPIDFSETEETRYLG